ncbi:MAG: SH3 domain-containing protein [Nitrospira sp.]
MKWLLLLLGLGCAAVYAVNTLFFDQTALPTRTAENTEAPDDQTPAVRRLGSWGPYLPGEAEEQKRPAPLVVSQPTTPSAHKNTSDRAKSFAGTAGSEASAAQSPAPDKPSLLEIDGAQQNPAEWAKIILGATVHSEASVSSPTVGYYRVGAELQVVRRENGWIQLSDPVTQKRGWVFEKYLSSIDGPTVTQAALDSTSEAGLSQPIPSKPVLPSSKKRTRAPKPPLPLAAKPVVRVAEDAVTESDARSGRWARRAERRRGIGPFMFGPSVGF